MPENTPPRDAVELTPFVIADWLWSFRWLAAVLLLCAAIWSGLLFWTAKESSANPQSAYELTIKLYGSGTPVRGVTDIESILQSRLASNELTLEDDVRKNVIVFRTESRAVADAAAAEAGQITDQLVADVRSQTTSLTGFMARDIIPEAIAGQYMRNTSFLEGVEGGLIQVAQPTVSEVVLPGGRGGTLLLLPWIACGVLFLALAGATTFFSKWRAHRSRK